MFDPTVYVLTMVRGTNKATATIQHVLRAIMLLHLVLDQHHINLDERLNEFRLLEIGEIEDIISQSNWQVESIVSFLEFRKSSQTIAKITKRIRNKLPERKYVHIQTAAIRLRYIQAYLKWKVMQRELRMGALHPKYSRFHYITNQALQEIEGRISGGNNRNTLHLREGLEESEIKLLEDSILPDSPNNPWLGDHPRHRNYLLIRWLRDLGVRRGELLGIRIQDINFQKNEVTIVRRADELEDSRKYQPNAKTKDRLLDLGEGLSKLTREYILSIRKKIKNARKHDYLFVANGTGLPLSLSALNKIFQVLRDRIAGLPDDLSPHVLRHTWNEDFSKELDRSNVRVSDNEEAKMRSRLMGWSETSNMAATYTRRHIREKAKMASLALQRKGMNIDE